MKSIENITELRTEIIRLKIQQSDQESLIKQDIEAIKQSLKPLNMAKKYISDMFSTHGRDNDLITKGAGLGASVFIKNYLLKGSPYLVRKIVGFFAENLSTNVVADREETILDKIRSFFGKKPRNSSRGAVL